MSDASPYLGVELQVEDEPPPADVALLADRLYQYNAAVSGWNNGRWLTILVRNEAGEIVAGLHGWTWGQTGFVQTLWVREDLRRAGLGARLLATAEVEAVRRGCREMHLDTHSYQAPDFYRHRGYEVTANCQGGPTKRRGFSFEGRYPIVRVPLLRRTPPDRLASRQSPAASKETARRSHDASRSILDDEQAR